MGNIESDATPFAKGISAASESIDAPKIQELDEPNEVSYTVLCVQPDGKDDVLQKVATAINVRLAFGDNQDFPFVEFDRFDGTAREDKIFLYGPSGSGKSRSIFEIVRRNIGSFERIVIINPRNNVGGESGRIRISELASKFGDGDAVVWDNFPDDLIKRDIVNARKVLEIVSSRTVSKLLVVLKPKYLEILRELPGTIPEFSSYSVTYDRERIKNIIRLYGTRIAQFKEMHDRFVANDLDRISKILWQREPTPLTILDYYSELGNKAQRAQGQPPAMFPIDGISEAERLLRSTNYYDHQFALLTGFQERRSDVEFLYVLKLCYELGIERDGPSVEKLQREIFGSAPPGAPDQRLGTWVYLSGQYYSMHDVCREAVRFTDFVRLKILGYMSENLAKMADGKNDGQSTAHSVAMFLGRNIQFMPRDPAHPFVPEGVYRYMKSRGTFERAIGQGAGEVFESLDEDLQRVIVDRVDTEIEFGNGLAESLGHIFPCQDCQKRQQMLGMIYSGMLFARYFGISLGRLFRYLSDETKQEIFAHLERNAQFADGVGIGVGHVYGTLGESLQREALKIAEKNIDMSRGLGYGFGLAFPSISEQLRSEAIARAETSSEFDKGIGMGLGELYHRLPDSIKAETLKRRSVRSEFAFGLGITVARSNAEQSFSDLLELADSDAEFAHGLGMGYGTFIVYLDPEFRSSLLSQADANARLDLGLGSGIGFLFKHLPAQVQSRFLERADANNEFDHGIGFGLGFTWMYLNREMRDRAFARAAVSNSFSQGLGYGLGYHYRYFDDALRSEIMTRAGRDSEFSTGLGYGLGYAFTYFDSGLQESIFQSIETNGSMALGLGTGLGRVYRYLSDGGREKLFAGARGNSEFARGVGYGLGRYVIMYTDREFQSELFARTKENSQMAYGFGEGLGYTFRHVSVEFQNRILGQMALKNQEFSRGLGLGLGRTFRYLPRDMQDRLFKHAEQDIHFARGFGESIGSNFKYLKKIVQDRVLESATGESAFARGLGYGMGSVYAYLPEHMQREALRRAEGNGQLARGLGAGLGSVHAYMPAQLQVELASYAARNSQFAGGLGEGIGSILRYTPLAIQSETVAAAGLERNADFIRGLGYGFGYFYAYYGRELRERLQSSSTAMELSNAHFAAGLGNGLGAAFASLSQDLQSEVFGMAEQSVPFAAALGFGIGHVFPYLPAGLQFEVAYRQAPRNPEFARGFGLGLGHSFVFLPSQTQEQAFALSRESKSFAAGLGNGLGRIFRYLDSYLEQEILKNVDQNLDFANGLGLGLGHSFPLLPERLQRDILPRLESIADDNPFAWGLAVALKRTMKYLDKNIQDQTWSMAKANPLLRTILFEESGSIAADGDDGYNDQFPVVGITMVSSSYFATAAASNLNLGLEEEEISFSGQRTNCCICMIDMINSTKVTSGLNDVQLGRYYAIFLNAMATIAKNFGAKIVKNAGDSLIFYFPNTTDLTNIPPFRDVLECGITMIAAHAAVNAKLLDERMPSVNYRISADYGKVEIARSSSSQSDDLFGPTMNRVAKINYKALANGMVIGSELYQIVKSLEGFVFEKAEDYVQDDQRSYSTYHAKSSDGRNIMNPFKRTSMQ